jgi:signal transduction histidine kinase
MDESCNINHILDNCLIILNNEIFDRINVEQNYTDDHILVKGNAANLHHALLNILTNSIQAIEGEGRISIKSAYNSKFNKTIIEIEDTGKGIEPEIIEKVMEPFFTTKDPGKGAGLGLSISYRIIEEHQGKIVITSKVGKGTLVRIELPSAS